MYYLKWKNCEKLLTLKNAHTISVDLEKAMALHSSTLAGKIPWTEEPGGLQSMGSLRVRHYWATSLLLSCIGEGNGNPLQYSCLESPRDGGAWWAAVNGVAQSRPWLKQLSSSSSRQLFLNFIGKMVALKLFWWKHNRVTSFIPWLSCLTEMA